MELYNIAKRQSDSLKERDATIEIPKHLLEEGEDNKMTFRYKKLNPVQQKHLTEQHPKTLELAMVADRFYKDLSPEEIQEKVTPEHMALFVSNQSFAMDVICETVTHPKITKNPNRVSKEEISIENIPSEIIDIMFKKITEQELTEPQKKA